MHYVTSTFTRYSKTVYRNILITEALGTASFIEPRLGPNFPRHQAPK